MTYGTKLRLPLLAGLALAGSLTLGACSQMSPDNGNATMTCPNLDATAQQYMQGTARNPVRCGPQADSPTQSM